MIWAYILAFFVAIIGFVLQNDPTVTTLPTINGTNLDTTMQQAIAYFHTITVTMWYIGDVWTGALILMGYYALKMFLRFILGYRAPGTH